MPKIGSGNGPNAARGNPAPGPDTGALLGLETLLSQLDLAVELGWVAARYYSWSNQNLRVEKIAVVFISLHSCRKACERVRHGWNSHGWAVFPGATELLRRPRRSRLKEHHQVTLCEHQPDSGQARLERVQLDERTAG